MILNFPLWCILKHDKNCMHSRVKPNHYNDIFSIFHEWAQCGGFFLSQISQLWFRWMTKFRSFFSDQIQYLHMQFYHFRRIWALKRVNERMWVVGKYLSLTTTRRRRQWYAIHIYFAYLHSIDMRWETISIEVLYNFLWQWFIVNSTLLLDIIISKSKTSTHWSDFIWLKRIIVIISVNDDDNDKWTWSDDVRWCISNVEQRLQSHKFFISSLKAKKSFHVFIFQSKLRRR